MICYMSCHHKALTSLPLNARPILNLRLRRVRQSLIIFKKLLRRFRLQVFRKTDPRRHRIFGVGLSKTATTTLCDALNVLGFKSIHYAPIARISNGKVKLTWPWWIEDYDAMADLPVAATYWQLAERFPNATFILTTRDEDAWLTSAQKHFNATSYQDAKRQPRFANGVLLDAHMYGQNVFDEDVFRKAFRAHNEAVRKHFADHPRFYELDICGGDSWKALCDIVDQPIPDVPFPKSNVRQPTD